MKILIFNTLYYPNIVGGAEKSIKILAESLTDSGYDVTIASIGNNKIEVINGVKVHYLPLKNLYFPFSGKKNEFIRIFWHVIDIFNIFMFQSINRIILNENPDIIHTNNLSGFSTLVWFLSKKHNIPIVHTLRDYYLLCHLSTMYRNEKNCITQCNRCKVISLTKRLLSYFPDAVVGISKYILYVHLKNGFFKHSNIKSVIPNSINCIYKDQKKLDLTKIKFGFLGRISPEKGVDQLINCFIKIKNSNCELRIAGTGEKSYVHKLKMKTNDKIKFLGFVKKEILFKNIDVLIVPSKWNEPFGRSIIEAYTWGIPVIGSNLGGIRDLIENSITGILFNPYSEKELTRSIQKLINNPGLIEAMSRNCIEKSQMFNKKRITYNYVKLYKNIRRENNIIYKTEKL